MNRVTLWLCLPLLLLPASSSLAQSEKKMEDAVKKNTATAEGENMKPKPKAKSSAKKTQQAPEIFIPSEAISEDLSVSFPVDI